VRRRRHLSIALRLSSATSGLARGFLYGRLASLEHERRGGGDHRWSSWGRRRACPCPRLVCRCVLACCSCCMITACQCRGRWMVDAACQVFISLYSSSVSSQIFKNLTNKYIKILYLRCPISIIGFIVKNIFIIRQRIWCKPTSPYNRANF
jgi:hypothetical protein